MTSPVTRQYISPNSKPGGWYSEEDFLNELSVLILASSTVKALSVGIVDSNGNQVSSFGGISTTIGTHSNVVSSATNVTLLASNTSRKGTTIFNDSTQVLYVKLGATASATSYTVQMVAGAYYEVPFGYTGIIDGIWAAANGNARVVEFT